MATKKETVKVCDVCKKRVSDGGEVHFGGHPHAGWFAVEMHGGRTNLKALQAEHEWDVCGKQCLQKLAATIH